MLAVCSRKFSQQQGISPIASIASIGISRESNAIGTDTICTGQGLAKAMNAAVTTAGAQINKQYCDINGERICLGDKVVYDYKGESNGYFIVVFEHNAFRKKYPNWDDTLIKPLLEFGNEAKIMRLKVAEKAYR